jgi:transcriptional regulator with GAF, ATPase, and Fis domain
MDERVAAAGGAMTEEEIAPLDDGPHTYISVKCPLRDNTGRIYAVFGISTDITERKEAERKLQTQFERLGLVNQITRAIGERQDLQSIFQVVVARLEEEMPVDFCCICLYDYPAEMLIASSLGKKSERFSASLGLTEGGRIPVGQNGLWRCVHGQLVHEPNLSEVQFPFPQQMAHSGLGSLVAAPLAVESDIFGVLLAARSQAGGFTSADCEFLRQLSEHVALAAHQVRLHNALQRAYDDLRQTQQAVMQQERLRALGQMASGIAHDINNALSPVALYAESLLENERGLTPRGRDRLEVIQRSIGDFPKPSLGCGSFIGCGSLN